jgi:GDPmannose 4,6-dehydratase
MTQGKRALITGITGQDGSYLSELLLEKGYEVHGIIRRTSKITQAIARILSGNQRKLYMGNLDAKRDLDYTKNHVEAMWLMLQEGKPDDYFVATGETHTVGEFLEIAFKHVNLKWENYVEFERRYLRPTEVDLLI